jgi:hypothetical protein
MTTADDAILWIAHLNAPRRAAVLDLAERGQLSQEILAAVRDEKYAHAAGLLLSSEWAHAHRFTGARLARQIETGERQE